MGNRVAIGDIHGEDFYKDHIGKYSETYVLGDYFDTFLDISAKAQIDNFLELCDLARNDPSIHLCLGNHDFHYYLNEPTERYSGFQEYHRFDIKEAIDKNIDLLNICYVTDDNYIISHAGVTKQFAESCGITDPLELNSLFRENPYRFRFSGHDVYGDNPSNGPLWVRPKSLLNNLYGDYKQIVGHTRMQFDEIKVIGNVTFIDVNGRDVLIF